jgi:hypothetical protein
MTVVTPAEVARRAATIFVDMPPVPRLEPALDTIPMSIVHFRFGMVTHHLLAKLQCLPQLQ